MSTASQKFDSEARESRRPLLPIAVATLNESQPLMLPGILAVHSSSPTTHYSRAEGHCIERVPPPTATKQCGNALKESHGLLLHNSVAGVPLPSAP